MAGGTPGKTVQLMAQSMLNWIAVWLLQITVESLPFLNSCLCCCLMKDATLSCNYTGEYWSTSIPLTCSLPFTCRAKASRLIFSKKFIFASIPYIRWSSFTAPGVSTHAKILVLTSTWWSKLDLSPDPLNLRGLWSFSPAKHRCTPPVLMLSSITIGTTSAVDSTSYRSGTAFTGVQWSWPQTEKLYSKATWSKTRKFVISFWVPIKSSSPVFSSFIFLWPSQN